MQNPKELKDAFEDANNASGSSAKELEKYLDGIQGKIDQFNNSVQSMWSNALDSDMVKDIVSIGTWLVKATDKIGLFESALIGLAGFSMIKSKTGPIAFFKGIIEAGTQGIAKVTNYVDNLKNVTFETNELSNAKTELTQVQLKEKLINTGLTDSVAEEIVAKTNLGKATDELNASTLDATLREAGYSKEKRESIIQSIFNTQATNENSQANKDNAVSSKQAGAAKDQQNADLKENEAALDRNTQKVKQNAQANVTLGQKIKTLSGSIGSFIKQNASTFIAIGTTLLTVGLTRLVDKIVDTMDEIQEEFDASVAELDATNSELSNLESQLKDINKQIDELKENTPISFTDQEEILRLEAQSAEIQRQIDLTQTLKKQQAISVNSNAIEAARKYKDVGINSGKTTGQATGDAVKVAGGLGVAATGAAASMAAFGTAMSWNAVGWIALIAAAVTAAAGGIAYAVSSNEDKVGESLDNMKSEYERLQDEYDTARANYQANASDKNKKKFEEAQEAFSSYQSNMASYMTEMDSYYSQIKQNWEQATRDQKNEYIEWQDTMDTWAIQSGGANAKSNAITRIFGDEAEDGFKQARNEIDSIKTKLREAQDANDELAIAAAMAELENVDLSKWLSDAEIERLRSLGIYLYEAKDALTEVIKTESEFIDSDLEDVAKDINKITDGLASLKSAFEEVVEEGVLTAKTVMSLKEELKINDYSGVEGVTDAWREYLDVMMSGTATTDEMTTATEQLAQAIMEAALASENGLTPDNKFEYVAQLRALGVNNAEEYVNDLLQKNMVKDIEDKLSDAYQEAGKAAWESNSNVPLQYADQVWDAMSEEKRMQAIAEYGNDVVGKLSTDTITEIAEAYGATDETIGRIIEKLNEQKKLEADIAKYKDSQDKFDTFREQYEQVKQDYLKDKQIVDEYGITDEQVVKLAEKSESWKKYLENKQLYEKLFSQGVTNEWVDESGNIIKQQYDQFIGEANNTINQLSGDINKELTLDVKFELELQNKNELVDEMQEVYDTLANAEKEYNENGGYVSVDTLQSLLQLEPKYLSMLYDENDQLNLNKQTILQVAQARTLDMGIQAAQNVITQASEALEANKINRLKELTDVTYNQADANWALVESNLATLKSTIEIRNADVKDEMYGQLNGVYEGIEGQVLAIKDLTNQSVANLQNSFSSAGNTAAAETEDAFKKAMEYWENRIGANKSLYEQIQNDIDLLEKKGQIAGESYYEAQQKVEEERLAHLKQQRTAANDYLKQFDEGSDKWWEIANTLNDIESEIDDVTSSLQDLKDAMDQVHWTIFDEAHERFGDLTTQLSNVREILSTDEDSFFTDDGAWTDTGVSVLGTYIQEIELYKDALADIDNELANIDMGDFDSEQEYYDKLTELINQQHEYTLAINDSEQSIVDMYESNVDAIEEYTQTLIESYNDYIDVVKEALDAERDLYDFKKNIQKQNKDIAEIERRISSLSGSTNKADIAERRKLEAQLYESKESLNDAYYVHAKESQQDALDSEREAYEENMNRFVEGLRTSLEEATRNMDEFLMSVTSMVTLNADTVLAKYESTQLPLSTALTNPWEKAKLASNAYSGDALDLMNQWTKEDGFFDKFNISGTNNLTSPWNAGKTAADAFGVSIKSTMESVYKNVQSNVQTSVAELDRLKQKYNEIKDSTIQVNTGGGNGEYTNDDDVQKKYYATATLSVAGTKLTATQSAYTEAAARSAAEIDIARQYENLNKRKGVSEEEYTKFWDKTYKNRIQYVINRYAKGTSGTTHNQFAIVDELGPELILHADPTTGRLQYLTKGSGVMTADATAELMKLADIGVEGLMMPQFDSGVNMMTNYIMKPEFKIDIEEFVHVDRVDQDTLPKLEAMMDKKINDFGKALNYSIKRFTR